MDLSAFAVVQIAVGVLLGNLMALALWRGYRRAKTEYEFHWESAALVCGPAIMIALVLIGSTG